jgi:uncharacterized membrane protein
MALLIALHVLAVVVWVGGMFFAYMVLRPSAGPLEAAPRLELWRRTLARFFPWVWASIVILLATGYAMILLYLGGFAHVPLYVNVMQAIGIVMMLIFLHLFFAPWRRFRTTIDGRRFPEAAKHINQMRVILAVNLVLGLVTVIVGASGRFW